MSDSQPRFGENPPPGKHGRMTVLPDAGPGNAPPEELTWPTIIPARRIRCHFLADTTIPGNLTPEEMALPVVDTGSEVITPRPAPAPVAEPSNEPESALPVQPDRPSLRRASSNATRPSELATIEELLKKMQALSGTFTAISGGSMGFIGPTILTSLTLWPWLAQFNRLNQQLREVIGDYLATPPTGIEPQSSD